MGSQLNTLIYSLSNPQVYGSFNIREKTETGKYNWPRSIKTEREYFDFLISGQSLEELLGLSKLPDHEIGVFGWFQSVQAENRLIDEFLGVREPGLESGRTTFFVCPECGDIGCGAITGEIEFTDDTVIWKDFGVEDDSDPVELENHRTVGLFVFNKQDYLSAIKTLRRKV